MLLAACDRVRDDSMVIDGPPGPYTFGEPPATLIKNVTRDT